jgi:hypothetical protein
MTIPPPRGEGLGKKTSMFFFYFFFAPGPVCFL